MCRRCVEGVPGGIFSDVGSMSHELSVIDVAPAQQVEKRVFPFLSEKREHLRARESVGPYLLWAEPVSAKPHERSDTSSVEGELVGSIQLSE